MRLGWIGWAVLAVTAAGPAAAQNQDALYVKSLAATCANCHGTNGKATMGSSVPAIAGMPREHIATQLKAFKAGTRQATIMHQLSKGFTDAQIEQLATHFAAQR